MDLLERYLAAVEQELPVAKKQDVIRELRANILDKLDVLGEQSPGQPDKALLHEVLVELGPPRAMAHRFDPPQPLIRNDHIPIYRYTLFLVFGVLFLIQLVSASFLWLGSEQVGFPLMLKAMAGGFIGDASFAFTVITVGFWVMGRQQESDCPPSTPWNPARLPPLTRAWQRIGLSDIFHDLGTYLFLLILIWYPVWATVPGAVLLSESGRVLLQAFSPLLLLGMVLGVWQLRRRIWTPALLKANLILNGLLLIAILALVVSGPLLAGVPERLQWMSSEQLAQSITISLLILTLWPGWQIVRDWRRLRQLDGSPA